MSDDQFAPVVEELKKCFKRIQELTGEMQDMPEKERPTFQLLFEQDDDTGCCVMSGHVPALAEMLLYTLSQRPNLAYYFQVLLQADIENQKDQGENDG